MNKKDWDKKLDEYFQSGLSMKKFCAREKLPLKQFEAFRYTPEMRQKYPAKYTHRAKTQFIPVEIEPKIQDELKRMKVVGNMKIFISPSKYIELPIDIQKQTLKEIIETITDD